MMTGDKPQITATIKFRGVTIEDMTIDELRQLRDALNQLVGERVIERKEYVPYYPWGTPWITYTGAWTVNANSSNTLRLGSDATKDKTCGDGQHFTLTCN